MYRGMEKARNLLYGFRVQSGLYGGYIRLYRAIIPEIAENQVERNMENEMERRLCGDLRFRARSAYIQTPVLSILATIGADRL